MWCSSYTVYGLRGELLASSGGGGGYRTHFNETLSDTCHRQRTQSGKLEHSLMDNTILNSGGVLLEATTRLKILPLFLLLLLFFFGQTAWCISFEGNILAWPLQYLLVYL